MGYIFVTRIKEDALMVETPQSVPTAPSMQRHTMRVVLVIEYKKDLVTHTGMSRVGR